VPCKKEQRNWILGVKENKTAFWYDVIKRSYSALCVCAYIYIDEIKWALHDGHRKR
jgi:hypothetical protein